MASILLSGAPHNARQKEQKLQIGDFLNTIKKKIYLFRESYENFRLIYCPLKADALYNNEKYFSRMMSSGKGQASRNWKGFIIILVWQAFLLTSLQWNFSYTEEVLLWIPFKIQ